MVVRPTRQRASDVRKTSQKVLIMTTSNHVPLVDAIATATLLVCRGCCCGTDKHEDVDHDLQVDALRAAVAELPGSRLRITDCLGPCGSSNVIAVRHRDLAKPGVRIATTWLGTMLDPTSTEALANWIRTGAKPHTMPDALVALMFDPLAEIVTPDHEITYLDGDPFPTASLCSEISSPTAQ